MIFPNMIPTNGMNIASLNLILSSNFINRNVPSKAKKKALPTRKSGFAAENASMDTRIPNLAESIVPAVVGETNLFRLNCCIINPQMAMLAPAMMILIKRGSRLCNKICCWNSFKWKISVKLILETPIKTELTENTTKAITKYLIFIANHTFIS